MFEIYKETITPHVSHEDAVQICKSLGQGWRLPTIVELSEMNEYQNRGEMVFGNYGCWSSDRFDDNRYYSFGFLTGNIYINEKNNKNLVRPVRDVVNIDNSYWASELPRPLSPDDEDVSVFKKKMINGTSLLLGCTKNLIPLTDVQMDIDPWYQRSEEHTSELQSH